MSLFVDAFWNKEICNFTGFEIICRHVRDGKHVIKEYVEFLRLRAQAQEAYGRTLVKLSRTADPKDNGVLHQALTALKNQTEDVGLSHISTAMSIQEEANRMMEFAESQQEKRKVVEENVRKQQANLKGLHKKVIEHKKSSDVRCREAEVILSQCQVEMLKQSTLPKEVEKFRQKQIKASQIIDMANQSYKSALHSLDNSLAEWEQETRKAYQVFQKLEEDRIENVRNSVWLVVNLISVLCVIEDEACEAVRKILERCDIKTELLRIIQEKNTGSEKPLADIDCENIYSEVGEFTQSVNLQQYSQNNSKSHSNSHVYKPAVKVLSMKKRLPPDGGYESVPSSRTEPDKDTRPQFKPVKCKVVFDFTSKNPAELSLRVNDNVRIITQPSGEWCEVETKDGKIGYCPSNLLVPLEEHNEEEAASRSKD